MATNLNTKKHPITHFREVKEARDAVVRKSLHKMQLAGAVDSETKASTTTPTTTTTAEDNAKKAADIENKRIASLSGREYRKEKKGANRVNELNQIKTGTKGEGKFSKALKGIGATIGTGVAALDLYSKAKQATSRNPSEVKRKGGTVKSKKK